MPRKPKQKTRPTKAAPTAIAAYYSGLRKIVKRMADLVDEQIDPILATYEERRPKELITDADPLSGLGLEAAFQGLMVEAATLERLYQPLIRRALWSTNLSHRRQFISSFKEAAGVNLGKVIDPTSKVKGWLIDKGVVRDFESAVTANVQLIKTIPSQYLDKVQASIYSGIRSGLDAGSIKKDILKLNGQNYKRAKLIARDQIQKFNSVLTMTRQQDVGVEGYIWRTSSDERVRDSHMEKDGLRFSWNSPPGDTGPPGQDINCRCSAEPDLTNLLGGVGLV